MVMLHGESPYETILTDFIESGQTSVRVEHIGTNRYTLRENLRYHAKTYHPNISVHVRNGYIYLGTKGHGEKQLGEIKHSVINNYRRCPKGMFGPCREWKTNMSNGLFECKLYNICKKPDNIPVLVEASISDK